MFFWVQCLTHEFIKAFRQVLSPGFIQRVKWILHYHGYFDLYRRNSYREMAIIILVLIVFKGSRNVVIIRNTLHYNVYGPPAFFGFGCTPYQNYLADELLQECLKSRGNLPILTCSLSEIIRRTKDDKKMINSNSTFRTRISFLI